MPKPNVVVTEEDAVIRVRVELPDVSKASEVDLNISATRVALTAPTR